MLKAEGIIKKYQIPGRKKDLLEALSGVSIELADNSITAIVGESGSGKSTLARILSYIELPDAGKVTLDNLTVTGVKRKTLQKMRGKVQLVMQDAASSLDPHQNVLQILDEPLHLLLDMGKEDRKKRVEELLDMVNLGGDILNRRPDELSGGQQKRLCVARALATEPQHIIFDESFSGLDVTLRKQILRKQILHLLRNLRDELRLSYLIITHDLDIAMYMADTIHVMRFGKIIETVYKPQSFSDFHEPYSNELVKAALSKRQALQ